MIPDHTVRTPRYFTVSYMYRWRVHADGAETVSRVSNQVRTDEDGRTGFINRNRTNVGLEGKEGRGGRGGVLTLSFGRHLERHCR